MTKEERLASVGLPNTPAGVAKFYKMFPSMESHDNYLANGGQPTAKEFFNFGATTNLNIPFGNFAYGGVPCMDCGGYMQDGGFMDMLNSVSKEYKKHITKDTVIQGGNDLNPGQKMTMQFKNKLAQNFQNASIDEIHNEFKQMGGANYGTGIDYQNQAFQNMYQTKINQGKSNLKNDVTDLFQGITAMNAPENQFNKTTITQAQYGMPVGPNLKGGLTPEQQYMLKMSKFIPGNVKDNTAGTTTASTNNFSPEYQKSQRRNELIKALENKKRLAINKNMSDEDLENLARTEGLITKSQYLGDTRQPLKNSPQQYNTVPAAYAQYYIESQHKGFGPWSKTRTTFTPYGYYNQGNPNAQGNTTSQNQTQNTTQSYIGDPSKRPYQPLNDDQLFQLNGATMDAPSNESWFSKWRAAQQGKSEDRARAKKWNNRPEETQTGINGAIYDYENDMPTNYNPKKMTNWDWYNPDEPVAKEFGGPIYQFAGAVQYDAYGNPIDPNKQMMKRNTFGSNATDNVFGTNNIFKGDASRNTFGTPKPQQNNQEAQGNSSFTIQNKYGPSLTGPAAASTLLAGVNTLASGIENSQDKSKEKLAELTVKNPLNNQSRGDYDQWGNLRVDQYVPVQFYGQFGGENNLPIAREGLDLKAGLYGTNGNHQFSLPPQNGKFSEPFTEVRSTLQPVAREGANVEAEKGEMAVINIDNLPTNFKIGGERHSKGGTPLNLPDDSFIFSDTLKMVIKDPIILAQFGMVPKKSGYTPAEIAKKYDINKFRKVLADRDSEDLEKKTAEMMIANYNMKLAKLALLQESMKGFPQGIPKMAMPYIEANEINPQDLIGGPNQSGPQQMDPNMISTEQGQSDEPDADMGVSKFGGLVRAQDGVSMQSILSKRDAAKKQAAFDDSENYMNAMKDAAQAQTMNALYNQYNKVLERKAAGDVESDLGDYLPFISNSAEKEYEKFKEMAFSAGVNPFVLENEILKPSKTPSVYSPITKQTVATKSTGKPAEQKKSTVVAQTNTKPADVQIVKKPKTSAAKTSTLTEESVRNMTVEKLNALLNE